MKDSVKVAATKFQAWKQQHSDDPGYCYDEIQEFASSLSRGELLEVFEWLETSYPIVVPEQVDREKEAFMYDWEQERKAIGPAEGSFIKKAETDLLERIERENKEAQKYL